MKKIQLLGFALFAALVFSAVGAMSAFAESEILLNEKIITENTETNDEGELTLISAKVPLLGKVEVLCSPVLMGYLLETDRKHFVITSILDLEGNDITELGAADEFGMTCVNIIHCTEPLVYVDDLPVLGQIVLMSDGTTLLEFTEDEEEPKGMPGFDIVCMGNSLEDLCDGLMTFLLSNGVSDVVTEITVAEMEAEGAKITCTVGEFFLSTDVSLISSPAGSLSIS